MDLHSSSFRLLLLSLMVLQNTAVVLLGRYTRDSKSEEDVYVVNHLMIVIELFKFIFSLVLEYKGTKGKLIQSLKENVIDNPLDCLKVMIPSLLYLLQNSLIYVALSNLTAPVFQVTYQTKLLTTAIVSVVMLQRKYSLKQWICLATLGLGVAIVVLGENVADTSIKNKEKSDIPEQKLLLGLVSVTVACLCSAFAGVYFEKVLKKPAKMKENNKTPASLWIRNMQMALFSVFIALVQLHNIKDTKDAEKKFCHGFTNWVWILVCLQAGGGLLVATIIKYADNVLKGMATGVSVVFGTLFSTLLFGTPLDAQFILGSFIILTSVFLFSNSIPRSLMANVKPKKNYDIDLEMQKHSVKIISI